LLTGRTTPGTYSHDWRLCGCPVLEFLIRRHFMEAHQKAVFISGASSGIGRSCASRLAESGFKVFAGVRTTEAAESIAAMAPGKILPIHIDITRKEDIAAVSDMLRSENLFGIVNNAGTAALGPFEFMPIDAIREQFEVNFFGHVAVTQALLPILRKNGSGRIINISSLSGYVAFPFFGAYACSKFAIEAFSNALRRELKPWKILISLIEPGNFNTAIWQKSFAAAKQAANLFPSEADQYYPMHLHKFRRTGDNLDGPLAVADAVRKALTVHRPKIRYRIGSDATRYAFLKRILPDRFFDWFV